MDEIANLRQIHMATPWPEAVTRGRDYGRVDAVMIGSDIYGYSSRVSAGEVLSGDERRSLAAMVADLDESIESFPESGRPYFQTIANLGRATLAHLRSN